MTKLHPVVMLLACLLIIEPAIAQNSAGCADNYISLPNTFLQRVNDKASHLENNIIKRTDKALKQLLKEEAGLRKKLYRKNAALANQLFQDATLLYSNLQQKITNKAGLIKSRNYNPFLDTLTTSLHFIEKNTAIASSTSVQQTLQSIHRMEDRFQQAKEIQQYLQNRRQYLREQLGKLNMSKALKQYHKKLYYYQAQIKEYRNIIKQPDELERKAIDLLSQTKPFQEFLAKNSIVSAIFPGHNNARSLASRDALPGLQTSRQINEIIQQTTGIGPNNLQPLQTNVQQAQTQLQQLKSRVMEMEGNEDGSIPDFRPNHQKVKSFWNRWELGANLQSTRSNEWLPSATQFGLSAGYKLNDRSVIGVGMAGSIGWGKSIRHIVASYEGIGARSFVDLKLKSSFWLSAGYEMNYRSSFNRIEQLNMLYKWQQSGLVGISKKYKVGKKMKGSMNLLWDYLSYSQVPRTQPIVFRFGYSFK
jgi:hypothetical protein